MESFRIDNEVVRKKKSKLSTVQNIESTCIATH